MHILGLQIEITETSFPYYELFLPLSSHHEILLCAYAAPKTNICSRIKLYHGSSSIIGYLRAIGKAISENKVEIVHAHTCQVGFLYLIYKIIRPNRLPTMYTVHSSFGHYKIRNKILVCIVLLFYKRIIFCSHASKNSLPKWLLRIINGKSFVVQNGVNISLIEERRRKLQETAKSPICTIVGVSRLVPGKNFHSLIKAFQLICSENARLIIIGGGPLKESLQQKICEYNLSKSVVLTGMLSRDQVYDYLLNADVYVSLSRYEGLPVAVLEAMACSCPVVLSDIPPHREIAQETSCATIVEAENIKQVASALKSMVEMPAEKRALLGEECYKVICGKYSLQRMLNEYLEMYTTLLLEVKKR